MSSMSHSLPFVAIFFALACSGGGSSDAIGRWLDARDELASEICPCSADLDEPEILGTNEAECTQLLRSTPNLEACLEGIQGSVPESLDCQVDVLRDLTECVRPVSSCDVVQLERCTDALQPALQACPQLEGTDAARFLNCLDNPAEAPVDGGVDTAMPPSEITASCAELDAPDAPARGQFFEVRESPGLPLSRFDFDIAECGLRPDGSYIVDARNSGYCNRWIIHVQNPGSGGELYGSVGEGIEVTFDSGSCSGQPPPPSMENCTVCLGETVSTLECPTFYFSDGSGPIVKRATWQCP